MATEGLNGTSTTGPSLAPAGSRPRLILAGPFRGVPTHHVLIAVAWALAFSAAPIELWLLLLPAILGEEVFRSFKHGFLPGFIPRAIAASLVVYVAHHLPVKPEDYIILKGLPTTSMPISAFNELAKASHGVVPSIDVSDKLSSEFVTFSAEQMTMREFLVEVSAQTGRDARLGRCGNGASILFGASPMGHDVTFAN